MTKLCTNNQKERNYQRWRRHHMHHSRQADIKGNMQSHHFRIGVCPNWVSTLPIGKFWEQQSILSQGKEMDWAWRWLLLHYPFSEWTCYLPKKEYAPVLRNAKSVYCHLKSKFTLFFNKKYHIKSEVGKEKYLTLRPCAFNYDKECLSCFV